MKLEDTVPVMTTLDYKDRFRAEYAQLKIREAKLKKMLCDWDNNLLPFDPTSPPPSPRCVYETQLEGMKTYASALEIRALIEDIDLYKD